MATEFGADAGELRGWIDYGVWVGNDGSGAVRGAGVRVYGQRVGGNELIFGEFIGSVSADNDVLARRSGAGRDSAVAGVRG